MSIILNKDELLESNSELRGIALEILEAGYSAINTEKILRAKLSVDGGMLCVVDNIGSKTCLSPFVSGHIYFVGIGKCALDGAKVIGELLGDYLTAGIVIDVRPAADAEALASRGKIKYFQGTHPLPSEQNVSATKEILEMVSGLTPNDLVVTLISGGGSALFELPATGFTLEDIIEKTKELTAQGTEIYEMNRVRKTMSEVKGGKFALKCAPAQVVSLIFSDVLGNDMSVIASGPTVLETGAEAAGEIPGARYAQHIGSGGDSPQPPTNILIMSNDDALQAMKTKAQSFGLETTIETEKLSGNAAEVGRSLAGRSYKSKTCVLFGGETTVKIPENHGVGGRNQEMALSALPQIKEGVLLVCAASDGFDNTDHAGALADSELFAKSQNLNLSVDEYLNRSDSYNFFKQAGGAICTGRLGSNVSDLCIIISK